MRRTSIAKGLVFAVALAISASASDGNNEKVFSSTIVGSTPGQVVGGVNAAGAPWVLREGRATISSSGRLRVRVEGLVLAPSIPVVGGTTAGIPQLAASVVCGGSGGAVVATTAGFPYSAAGDAEIEGRVSLPAPCIAPAVIVRIVRPAGAAPGAFIAVNGLAPSHKHD
jgi:hypothetical protein